MSEIKVGEYVRTKKRQIDRLQYEIENSWRSKDNEGNIIARCEKNRYWLEDIKNHKEKLIELLEEGDYVNGYELSEFDDEEGNLYLGIPIYDDVLMNTFTEIRPLNTIEIKSIVTKEQFKNIEYKV